MKRRTILAAVAAAPFIAITSTANALCFRRRRRCEQSPPMPPICVPYHVDAVSLTITSEGGAPGMETYRVVITAEVLADNSAGSVMESIREVKTTVPGTDINDEPMTRPSSPGNGNEGTYTFSRSGVMLSANQYYRANATAYIEKETYGKSAPVQAIP